MSHYNHLTSFERGAIWGFLKDGLSIREIGRKLNRNHTTIKREIDRNKGFSHYDPITAQSSYLNRRKLTGRRKILSTDTGLRNLIINQITIDKWSPEEIDGFLDRVIGHTISYSTIYRQINLDNLGITYPDGNVRGFKRYLRHQGKRRKTIGSIELRGKISISNSIHERPNAANDRSELGHLELDTIWGLKSGAVLVTAIDRKSRYVDIKKADSRKAEDVTESLKDILNRTKVLRSLTPDRGKEFTKHDLITNEYRIEFYFPDAHNPNQRGSNENVNGLIREYIPKHTDISNYSESDINDIIFQINHRPRKMFNYKSAYEVHQQLLKEELSN
jgi:IS30 family transposase